MTRHQPWFVYVPSAITVWCFTLHGGMAGRMFRRHAVRLRRALESSFAPHADCGVCVQLVVAGLVTMIFRV